MLAVAVGWGWAAAADRAGAAPWLDAADAVVAGAVVAGAVAADAAWGAEVPLPLLVLVLLVLLVLEFLLVLELPVLLVLAFVPLPLVLLLPVPPADPVVPAGPDPGAVLIVDALEPGWAALSGPVPEPGGPGPPLCGARDPLTRPNRLVTRAPAAG